MIAELPAGAVLLADKGYDANALRQAVSERGAWANIPPKSNRKDPICFSRYLYKARNLVERFFNKIKHYRRVATRYDKTAANFLAALQLVAVRVWLRANESMSLSGLRPLSGAYGPPHRRYSGVEWLSQCGRNEWSSNSPTAAA